MINYYCLGTSRNIVTVSKVVSNNDSLLDNEKRLQQNCLLLFYYIMIILYIAISSQFTRGDVSNMFNRNDFCIKSRTDGMNVEELWSKLTMIINQCSQRRFLKINGYRNHDEIKLHVTPNRNIILNSTNCTIVSLGIGGDVEAEKKMKRDMPECAFFGADPIKDPNQEMFEEVGVFYNIAIGGKNGTLEATVLELDKGYHIREVEHVDLATFLRSLIGRSLIDQLIIDVEWEEYDLLPYFLKSGDLENAKIIICQFNIEIHHPDYAQKAQFFEFFLELMDDNRYTPLAANTMLGHIRLYFLNHEQQECRRRYIAARRSMPTALRT
ncbi:hypothetical protein DICVIV_07754 [Dictyocaulus viviparus]|uniref:Methyltransferase FkbM domain-containing protein n=1 Tax=Dictyocaulus viviparus TaxID=29172 RepID=A0A0D8XNJ8_DICVI|nr:hypothetical protein DICVIV_07754 [Dictyocaulus viviparus]